MPEFTIPTTPEQWAAVEPNETDQLLHDAMSNDAGALQLAAASRLLEHEKNVTELAKWMCRKFGSPSDSPSDFEPDARRILEDAK